MSSLLTKSLELLEKIKNGATIKFIKKDGTERIMKCTVDIEQIPKEKRPKKIDVKNIINLAKKGVIRVYDIEKNDWRTVNCEKAKIIELKNNKT